MRGNFLTVLLFFITGSLYCQIENIKLDEAGNGRAPSEPTIAINPTNIDNIVGGAILDKVYFTFDGGNTWTVDTLTSPYGVWGDPVIISDLDGNFYYFHLSDPTGENWQSEEILDRIVVQKSKDGGKSWNKGSYMGLNHPKDQDKEWAVYDPLNKNLYATWTQFDKYGSEDPQHKSNILFSWSKNGNNWKKPVRINKLSGNCLDGDQTTEGAVPVVGMQGQIYVSWAYDEKIYFDRSYDGGKTWLSNDIEITDQPGGWSFDIPGIYRCNGMPVLNYDKSLLGFRGMLYLVWADQRNGTDDTDIWMSKSNSNGDRWSSPKRINDDGTGSHQFFPWAAVDQISGNLYIVYYDRRHYDDLRTDVYLAYSTDGGDNFTNIKISESPFIPNESVFFGDYINIAAHNGRIVPIWTRMDDGKTSIMTAIINHEDLGLEPIKIPETLKKKKKKKRKKEE